MTDELKASSKAAFENQMYGLEGAMQILLINGFLDARHVLICRARDLTNSAENVGILSPAQAAVFLKRLTY